MNLEPTNELGAWKIVHKETKEVIEEYRIRPPNTLVKKIIRDYFGKVELVRNPEKQNKGARLRTIRVST